MSGTRRGEARGLWLSGRVESASACLRVSERAEASAGLRFERRGARARPRVGAPRGKKFASAAPIRLGSRLSVGSGAMAGQAPDAVAADAAVKGGSAAMAEVRARARADEDPDVSATRTNPTRGATRAPRGRKPRFGFFGAPKVCGTTPVRENRGGSVRCEALFRRARATDLSDPPSTSHSHARATRRYTSPTTAWARPWASARSAK